MKMEEVIEDEKSYKIRLEVPGYSSDELKVEVCSVPQSSVTVSGKKEKKEESKTSFKSKSFSFSRTLLLPQNCLPNDLETNYENGVLILTVPKSTKEQNDRKQIPIKTNK